MSLLNKNNAFNVRDYLFAAAGLLCLFWFFLSYSSQDPKSAVDVTFEREAAAAKGVQYFKDLGYSFQNINSIAKLESHAHLLDSLQAHLGRQKAIEVLSDSSITNLHPYYWNVDLMISDRAESDNDRSDNEDEITIRLNEKGQLIEFLNEPNIIPNRPVNTDALVAAFESDPNLKLWKSLPDSAWDRLLNFDIQSGYTGEEADTMRKSDEQAHIYSKSNIKKLARYHLQNTGWNVKKLVLSDIQITTVRSHTAAEVTYNSSEPVLGQHARVGLTLLPTGTMLNLSARYNQQGSSREFPSVMFFVRMGLIFLFAFTTIILFYFRIRARAVDTTPALVAGVLGGLMIPILMFLQRWVSLSFFSEGFATIDMVGLALSMGFAGALTSIGFFIVFAVGDSLMRQYWPEKLHCYDYLRQGMFFNKPVGETIIRSLTLAFILCGLWSTALFMFPDLYFNVDSIFLDHHSAWAPIYLFLDGAWFSLILITAIFAVAGTQAKGMYKSRKISAGVIIAALTVITPLMQSFGPPILDLAVSFILALFLTAVFLKWDLITTIFTHFIFILVLKSSSGWMVGNSPDFYVFIILCVFLMFNMIAGIVFVTKGKEQQSLPGFVPEYVEELAQEERIKQELQIAREVQQSFLPVETPTFKNLDIAAICKPAYETGGDYYDFVRLSENRIAITIGDVSGKGIQAAFYMTFIKGILHSLCRESESPSEILKKTNRLFYDNAPRGTFISLVFGIVDLETNKFHFARAGHNPIIKMNEEQDTIQELRPQGIGIGLIKGASFDNNIQEMQLSLEKNDILVLYTDGIVEALNEKHEFFGNERLNNLLDKYKKLSSEKMLQSVSAELTTYIGEEKQHDDMTMIIMKLNNSI